MDPQKMKDEARKEWMMNQKVEICSDNQNKNKEFKRLSKITNDAIIYHEAY